MIFRDAFPRYSQYGLNICPRYDQDMSKIGLAYVQNMSQLCLRYVLDMSQKCQRYVPNMSQICPRYIPETSKITLLPRERWDDFDISQGQKRRKLDGVGPADNRPSTDKLHYFVKKKIEK